MSDPHPNSNSSDSSAQPVPNVHLSSGAAALVATKVLGLLLNIVSLLLLPRFLGPASWGVYVVWVALWGVSTEFFESGVGVVMNRFLPLFRDKHPDQVLRFQHGLLSLKIAILPVVWVIGWMTLGSQSSEVFHNRSAFSLVILSAFLYSWASLDAGLLFNYHRMTAFGLFIPLNILLRLAAVLMFFGAMGQKGLPLAFFFGSLALTVIYLLLALPITKRLGGNNSRGIYLPIREFLIFGLWVGLGQFGFSAVARFPGLWAEKLSFQSEEIGYMGLSLFCYNALRAICGAVIFSLLPHLVSLSHKNKNDHFTYTTGEGWRYTNLLLFWLLLGLITLAPAWFPLFLGKAYLEGMPRIIFLLTWTLPAMIFGVWLSFFQQAAYARGRQQAFVIGAVLVLVSFPLALMATPSEMGIERVLIALALSLAAGSICMGAFSGLREEMIKPALLPLILSSLLSLPVFIFSFSIPVSLLVYGLIQTPLYFIIAAKAGLMSPTDTRRLSEVLTRILKGNHRKR